MVTRCQRFAIFWTVLILGIAGGSVRAVTLLLVTQNSALNSEETARKTQFESWGYAVTTIVDSSTQTAFNTALASANVAYIPTTVDDWELTNKLKSATIGVLCEERYNDDDMGFSTNPGWDASHTQINILNNTHDITTGLSTGYVTITSSSQPLCMMNATVASGMTVLGKQNYTDGNMLGVIEVGGTLAGGGTAAGRRVRLPWGGDAFAFSSLNTTGKSILQKAIVWAIGQRLIAHWKLNEASGTSASDSSGSGYTGSVTGTATWVSGTPKYRGFTFNGSTKIQATGLLGSPSTFTVAAWANLTAADTGGAEVISLGDDVVLRLDESGTTAKIAFYTGSAWVTASYSATYAGTGWHHFAGVFDNASDTLKLYIDGTLVTTTSTTANVSYSAGGTNTLIGCHGNGQTTYDFTGTLDDVRVYNYALTAAQIVELYGLVGYWKLNESSGTAAADSSGIGNNGTVNGTAGWTSAIHGNGFSADYTNGEDYVQIPNSASLENVQENSYSLAAWFKPTNLPPGTNSDNTAGHRIVGKAGWHLGLIYDNAGDFFVEHWLGTTPTWNGAGAWYMNAPGKWYHVAGVIDRDAGTIKLYLNGSLAETTTFTAGAAAFEYGTEPWRIGISYPAATNWGHAARGVIDDVRIYNRAIMPDEVVKLAGLMGYWKMNEGTGTTAADSSGLTNNATLSGGASWTTDCAGNNNALLTNGTGGIAATGSKFTPPNEGTVAFWMRGSGTPTTTARVLGLGGDWEIRQSTNGSLSFDLGASPFTGNEPFSTLDPVDTNGRWYHIAATFDAADDSFAVYVDGALRTSGTSPVDLVTQAPGVLSFGTRTGSAEYWSGALRDVRVYNRKLFPFEIAQLYGLMGRWKLVESSGTTATDQTLLANNGTYTNGVSLASSTTVPGTAEIAAKFDGTDDYVLVPEKWSADAGGRDYQVTAGANPGRAGRVGKRWSALSAASSFVSHHPSQNIGAKTSHRSSLRKL